jgi:hypothetical protein
LSLKALKNMIRPDLFVAIAITSIGHPSCGLPADDEEKERRSTEAAWFAMRE